MKSLKHFCLYAMFYFSQYYPLAFCFLFHFIFWLKFKHCRCKKFGTFHWAVTDRTTFNHIQSLVYVLIFQFDYICVLFAYRRLSVLFGKLLTLAIIIMIVVAVIIININIIIIIKGDQIKTCRLWSTLFFAHSILSRHSINRST